MNPRPKRIPRWPREFDRAVRPEILTRNSALGGHPSQASTIPRRGETGVGLFRKMLCAIFLDPAAAARQLIPEKNPASEYFFPWAESQKPLHRRQIFQKCA